MEHNKTYVQVASVMVCGVPQISDWAGLGETLKVTWFHSTSMGRDAFHKSITSILLFQKVVSPGSFLQPRCSGTAKGYTLSSVLFPQDETHHPKFLKQLLIGDKSKQQYKMVTTREVSKILLLLDRSIAPKYH